MTNATLVATKDNSTNKTNSTVLAKQAGSDPTVNITIDSNGSTSITVGGSSNSSGSIGKAGSSGSGTVTVDPLSGDASVSGTATGGANASVPTVAKEAAAKAVDEGKKIAEEAAKAADVAKAAADQAAAGAESVSKKVSGAIAGLGGLPQKNTNTTTPAEVKKDTPKVVTKN